MITYISCLMLIISNGWNKNNGWKILEKLISGRGDDYVVLKSIGSSKMGIIASKLKFQGL